MKREYNFITDAGAEGAGYDENVSSSQEGFTNDMSWDIENEMVKGKLSFPKFLV